MVAADPAAFLHARFVRMRTKCEFLSKDRRRRARSVGRMESNGRSRSCGFPASPMCAHAHKIQVPFQRRKEEIPRRRLEGRRWAQPILRLSCKPEMCACAQNRVPFRWRKQESPKRRQEGQRWSRSILRLSCELKLCACAQNRVFFRCWEGENQKRWPVGKRRPNPILCHYCKP